jgi:NAD(P)-dependent dehydrogenase (short-subunit alcohol dehydrogenase family)
MPSVAGRTVLITGGADGLGAATARRLVGHGANVAIVDVQADKAEALAAELGDRALACAADVRSLAELEAAVAMAVERFGGLDAVVASAAVDTIVPLADITEEAFVRTVDIDLTGCWRIARAAMPELRRSGGYLLFVSSGAAIIQTPYQGAYQVSKAGLGALANTLRVEERRNGVAVGLVILGGFDTEHARRSMSDPLMQEVLRKVPAALQKRRPVEEAAAAFEQMIERRTRQRVVPRSQRLMMIAPGLIQRMGDRSM